MRKPLPLAGCLLLLSFAPFVVHRAAAQQPQEAAQQQRAAPQRGTVKIAAAWPQFRGPLGDGHSDATGLPTTWSESENVLWRADLPGLGWSSATVQGTQVWLTTAVDGGKSLRAICLDLDTGKTVHDVEVLKKEEPGPIHSKNSHASPTPVIEGDRVYVHFGAHGTGCVSTAGEVLWTNTELKYNHRHGPGGSPVLYEDLLIFSCDGTDVQFVVALDKNTGKVRWKTDRQGPMAYCTPLLIRVGEQDQLFSPGGEMAAAYDPRTGEEIWRVKHPGYSVVPRPVFGDGMVFFSSSYNDAVLFAVRADGKGDVTASHVEWKLERGAPHNPSPLLLGDDLYLVSDNGIARCLDAASGKEHWQKRLGGNFSASPLFADGKLYFLNEEGECAVLKPGHQYEELARNQLPGRTLASLSAAGKSLLLRTDQQLWRLGAK